MANDKVYTDYLMHGRTKGSRNGISTTKGYTAIGRKAQGHWVNGHYVYYEDEARNRAFRQGKAEAAGRNSAYENQAMVNRMENARKADVLNQKIYGKKIKGYTRLADISPYEKQRLADKYLSNSPQHQTAVNQHNAEVAGKNAALAYAQKKRKQTNIGASQAADATRMNAETRNRVLGSSKASLKNGASNNWQQKANATSSGKPSGYNNAHYNAVSQAAAERKAKEAALERQQKASKKKSSILADVRFMPTNNPKDKYDYSGKNDDRATGFKEATFIDIYGNKTGGKVTKMDRTPYWDHMANAKTNKEFDKYAKKSKEFLDDFRASKIRNSRSDIGNAFADAKEDAKNAFKKLTSKFKKKKK